MAERWKRPIYEYDAPDLPIPEVVMPRWEWREIEKKERKEMAKIYNPEDEGPVVREWRLPKVGGLFCTVRVMRDGSVQVETDEGEWSLPVGDAVIAAGLILYAADHSGGQQ